MRLLLERVGNPQRSLRVLHIGGTNGKGSTAAMAATVLQHSGLRVGLYTSPHLVEFRERIRVNGGMITEEQVSELVRRLRSILGHDLNPTFFEMVTAMAFLYFVESKVDVAVLEVGLGGRFDATNVVAEPLACAITTIGLDHQEHLGGTEEAIAFEKGGIIKSGVPLVLGRIGLTAENVLRRIAKDLSAPVWQLGQDFHIEPKGAERLVYRGTTRTVDDLCCGLAGRHQWDNAACALALLDAAQHAGIRTSAAAARDGLRTVPWEGRLEPIEEYPKVILDGAHNPPAATMLLQYLKDYVSSHPTARIILVWAMMRDKDHRGFIAPLQPVVSEIVLTQTGLARSATVDELRFALDAWPGPVWEAVHPMNALVVAKGRAASHDLICIAGSLMLVGEVKAAVRGCGLSPIHG